MALSRPHPPLCDKEEGDRDDPSSDNPGADAGTSSPIIVLSIMSIGLTALQTSVPATRVQQPVLGHEQDEDDGANEEHCPNNVEEQFFR